MLTRRKMLLGTAAGSIAAIATDHGIAAATGSSDAGFSNNLCSVGQLDGGALGSFSKEPSAFNLFIKWKGTGVEAFYKERLTGGVDFFIKFFNKGWTPFSKVSLDEVILRDAEAAFYKITPAVAEFFIKAQNSAGDTINILTTLDSKGIFDVDVSDEEGDGELT